MAEVRDWLPPVCWLWLGRAYVYLVYASRGKSVQERESEMDDPSLELTIQMGDLEELARINPVAWEQLLHIVDNREHTERIGKLEDQLRSLGKSSKNLVDLQAGQIERDAAHIEDLEAHVDTADKEVVDAAVTERLEAALSAQHYPFYDEKHCPAS